MPTTIFSEMTPQERRDYIEELQKALVMKEISPQLFLEQLGKLGLTATEFQEELIKCGLA